MSVIFILFEKLFEVQAGLLARKKRKGLPEALFDRSAVIPLYADPSTAVLLGGLVRCTATTEGIKDQIVFVGGHENGTLGNHQFQLVDARSHLISLVSVGRGIFPEIRKV